MASRGERNNNPGNLEASPWTRGQPGYVGSDGRFAIFDTMENGIMAQAKLLYNRYLSKGYDTVEEVINRYGNDPGTQDDLSVRNYIKYVAARLGLNINEQIPRSRVNELANAMREFETGKTVKGVIDKVIGQVTTNPLEEGPIEQAINKATGLDTITQFFSGQFAGRVVAVIIGVILIGLAVAAFTLTTDIKGAALKAVT